MGDLDGERLARLEVKVDQLVTDIREHTADHRDAKDQAEKALDTAKQAALLTAISRRSTHATLVAGWIGGGIVLLIQIMNLALRLTGHG